MKKLTSFFAIITLLVIFSACNKDENQPATVINTDANGNTSINNVLLGQQVNALPKEVPLSLDESAMIYKRSIMLSFCRVPSPIQKH